MSVFTVKVVKQLPKRGNYYLIANIGMGSLVWYNSHGSSGVSEYRRFVSMVFHSNTSTIVMKEHSDLEDLAKVFKVLPTGLSKAALRKAVEEKLDAEIKSQIAARISK